MQGVRGEAEELRKALNQDRLNLLTIEFRASFVCADLAHTEYTSGYREAAERSLDHAEKAYARLSRYLSDPTHAARIAPETLQQFLMNLDDLRSTLDDLRRLIKRQVL